MSEQEKYKHEGKLNEAGSVCVALDPNVAFEDGCVHLANGWGDQFSLCADEALSLLRWLYERKDELDAMTKEKASE